MSEKQEEPKAPAQKRVPKYRKGQSYKMAEGKSIHCTGIGCCKSGEEIKLSHIQPFGGGKSEDAEMAFNQHLEAGTIVEA